MTNLKNTRIITAVGVLVVLAFGFYWFQWRPAQIKKDCVAKMFDSGMLKGEKDISTFTQEYDIGYKICLQKHGL